MLGDSSAVRRTGRVTALTLLWWLAGACGGPIAPASAEAGSAKPSPLARLIARGLELSRANIACPCMAAAAPVQAHLLAGVMRHGAAIDALWAEQTEAWWRTCTPMGPASLCPDPPAGDHEAGPTAHHGWHLLAPAVAQAEAADSPRAWSAVADTALTLLHLEVDRERGVGPVGSPVGGPEEHRLLGLLVSAAEACAGDETCARPDVDEDSLATCAALWPEVGEVLEEISLASNKAAMRCLVRRLAWISRGYYVEGSPYAEAAVVDKELVIPIHPGDFVGAHGDIARLVEEAWSQPGLPVRVHWQKTDGVARLSFEPRREGAAWDHEARVLRVGKRLCPAQLAYSFGRMLGLGNRAYVRWDEKTCTYTAYLDPRDLMCDGRSGQASCPSRAHLREMYSDASAN